MWRQVLLINASREPMKIITARRALKMIVKDKVVIELDRGIDPHHKIRVPSVVMLRHFQNMNFKIRMRNVQRKNILLRDDHRCMYCGKPAPPGERLTLDHVIPVSRGGKGTWENLVACCTACNQRKDNKTPAEAGMTLRHKPLPMNVHTSRQLLRAAGLENKEWHPFLWIDSNGAQEYTRRG